jgi:hypothetical protein
MTDETKREFIQMDCGLVATATKMVTGKWLLDVHLHTPVNMLLMEHEADLMEWIVRNGFKDRRPPRTAAERTAASIARAGQFDRRDRAPWPNMCDK